MDAARSSLSLCPVPAAIPTGDYSRRGGREGGREGGRARVAPVLSNGAENSGENETSWEDYEHGMK